MRTTLFYFLVFNMDVYLSGSRLASLVEKLKLDIETREGAINNESDFPDQYYPTEGEEFDFIIVGAGSAGAVVANRLTEVKGWKVLLIEAGGDPPKDSEVPALSGTLSRTAIDWQYVTDPGENNCLSLVNRSCRWPRGKVLGGSSTINYMLYVRGNAKDYDYWAEEGNLGWAYQDVLPYFRKSEDLRDPRVLNTQDSSKYHGRGGYLTVEGWESTGNALMKAFEKGYDELGYGFNPDSNGRCQMGFSPTVGNLRDHRRCSTAKAFLTTAKDRPNLKVSKRSLVVKVLIDSKTSRAIGIEMLTCSGNKIKVMARKEIVLSAGAVNTPQLLMLSGIGPRRDILQLGIPIIQDLPVGEELQDHPSMPNVILTFDKSPFRCIRTSINTTAQSTFNFLFKGKSSLSFQNGYENVAFINIGKKSDEPDVKVLYLYCDKNDTSGITSLFNGLSYNQEIIDQVVEINRCGFTVVLFASLLTPQSKGKITLKDSNPKTYPIIESGYLSNDNDSQILADTIKFLCRLANTRSLQNMGVRVHELRVSDCEEYKFPSDEYRKCTLRHLVSTNGHPCCTCGMGRVVDPELRVKGLRGLRVVDASAMPNITRGNINAPVIMVAEKASDLIKLSWTQTRDKYCKGSQSYLESSTVYRSKYN